MIKVSIIVPLYNVEQYAEKCLASLKEQTLKAIEILLIDDGSVDGTGAICDRYVEEDTRFKVYHIPNAGAGHARNVGLSVARGEYIGFVDSDDYVKPEMFEVLYEAAIKSGLNLTMCSHIDVIHGQEYPYRLPIKQAVLRGQEAYDELLSKLLGGMTLAGHMQETISGFVWRMLFKRSFIETYPIRFLSEREVQYEDLWFVVQAITYAQEIRVLQDQLYYYNQRPGSLMRSYKDHVWEMQCRLHSQLEAIAKGKVSEQILEQRLATRQVISVLEAVDQTVGRNPWSNRREVIESIKAIAMNASVSKSVACIQIGNAPTIQRLKLALIRNKSYRSLYYMTYSLCRIKQYKGDVK